MKKKVEEIEEMNERREERKFFQAVRRARKDYQPQARILQDKEGNLIGEDRKMLECWADHFEQLLSDKKPNEPHSEEEDEEVFLHAAEPLTEAPTIEEVERAISKMKNNKAAGEDNIPIELIKYGGLELKKMLHKVIAKVWEEETMPTDWRTGLIFPIYKKGDKTLCRNYRGISLLNVSYKIFSNILATRLSAFSEEIISEYQCGFRPNRSTIDQIFILRQTLEKFYEYGIDLHILFVDFQEAFDRLSRSALLKALREFGIPSKIINLIQITFQHAEAKIIIGNQSSRAFPVESGVRQGDGLSSLLFILTLHKAMKASEKKGTIMNNMTQIQAYADDVAEIARSEAALKNLFGELDKACKEIGLQVNENKTKYLRVSAVLVRRGRPDLTIGDYTFESVSNFTYIGADINSENKIEHEIKKRIMAGNRAYFTLNGLFRSRVLSKQTKMKLYKTLVRPVVTYASETWTMKASDERALRVFERRIIRRIHGGVFTDGEWRIRTNAEIDTILANEDIVRFIKSRRISWLGHVQRMSNDRTPKKILEEVIHGKRRKGRPRKRWIEDVEDDLRRINVRGWRTKAFNRQDWRKIASEAKVHTGL